MTKDRVEVMLTWMCGTLFIGIVAACIVIAFSRPSHGAELPKPSFLTKKFDLTQHPRVTVIGDSIALGLGRELCKKVKNCHVFAAVGRTSEQTIKFVDLFADTLVISVCTNDPNPQSCARNVTIIRQNLPTATKVIWIVPNWPTWANEMIHATAAGFIDGSVTFKPGCCGTQAKRHPASYAVLAEDTILSMQTLGR